MTCRIGRGRSTVATIPMRRIRPPQSGQQANARRRLGLRPDRRSRGLGAAATRASQFTHAREILAPVALGEKTVVTDAVKAVGQDVQQKAADELVRGEPHDALRPPRR